MTPAGRLVGKHCLIVGGTTGIGLASSRRFVEEGARVLATGRTVEETDEARRILNADDLFQAIPFEIAGAGIDEFTFLEVFAQALDFLGDRLDVLLHVAGISGRKFGDGALDECSSEGWDKVLSVNAKGVFLSNRAAVRIMKTQEIDRDGLRGAIVNVGSVLDRSPSPEFFGTIAYAAGKGAIRALTKSAAAKYASHRIRFNLIEPGLVDTPMASRAIQDPGIRTYLESKQPLASGPIAAEDVAEAALFLCEPRSRFVTGLELTVDGGWSMLEGKD